MLVGHCSVNSMLGFRLSDLKWRVPISVINFQIVSIVFDWVKYSTVFTYFVLDNNIIKLEDVWYMLVLNF